MSQDVVLPLEASRVPRDAEYIYRALQGEEWLTVSQVAELIERKVSPELRKMLNSMVGAGWLQRGVTYLPNGAKRYSYRVAEVQ